MASKPEGSIQREYYAKTARQYDSMHVAEGDEHHRALACISSFVNQLTIRSVLDVGCGTGRAVAYLAQRHPDLLTIGIEPVPELLASAIEKGVRSSRLVNGSGLELPFADGSFDAVVECGVLHHVREPARVVSEMTRVARKAVFLSDANIFGQGKPSVRLLKFILYKAGLWGLAKLIQTRGKGYTLSKGDGLAYSYSVFFQHYFLAQWADWLIAAPIGLNGRKSRSWSPVFSSPAVLLCAIRDENFGRRSVD